jgi:hypothetical protein
MLAEVTRLLVAKLDRVMMTLVASMKMPIRLSGFDCDSYIV